ncbi:hypothetical protein [Shinella zoogloeoides]|uniref:hypothetical protein n=1 Tax=Shinella zoogloeoides TaxID=352475 RepID=UPI0028A8E62D|nr:hypothetical protein [Shinella zoogloeoides]
MRREAKDKLLEFAMRARHTFLIAGDLREDLDSFHFHEIEGGEMDQLFRAAIAQAWDARSTLRELHNKIRDIAEIVENAEVSA